MTLAPKLNPTQPRPVTHFTVAPPPPASTDWRVIYCLTFPRPDCLRCNDTGYTEPYNGGLLLDYTCDCEIGDLQFEVELDALAEADEVYSEDHWENATRHYPGW